MGCVHQILSPSFAALCDCEVFFRPGDLLLLVDGGVDLLLDPERVRGLIALAGPENVRALRADVEARGLLLSAHELELALLTDREWVAAVRSHDSVLSWQ